MNLPFSLLFSEAEWHRGQGLGFQMSIRVVTLLAVLIVSVLLTRAYIRRRGSFLKNLQGPASSSFILGGCL
jgi:hypothetical protein